MIKEFFARLLSWRGLQGVMVLLLLGLVALIAIRSNNRLKADIARMQHNQQTMQAEVEYYKSRSGEQVATIEALTLERDEINRLVPGYINEIDNLRKKLRDVENMGSVVSTTEIEVVAPIEDYIHRDIMAEMLENLSDSLHQHYSTLPMKHFHWADQHNSIDGIIYDDSVHCKVSITDRLKFITYRKKKKCLFKRKGKVLGYDVICENPNTQILDIEYIEILK